MVMDMPKLEHEGLKVVAELMAIAAKTAPKGFGVDCIETALVYGDEKEELARYMDQLADELRDPLYKRDANSVRASSAVFLIGLKDGGEVARANCGACGFPSCEDMLKNRRAGLLFPGPTCMVRALDLGIAIGSAVKVCSILNVDNRIMFRVGVAARRLGYLKSDIVIGIPLAVKSKNPFFDRKT
ncbi:MAG: ferredoxin domain-containing protein [Candidatus Nezhaarchaeales archaeon]